MIGTISGVILPGTYLGNNIIVIRIGNTAIIEPIHLYSPSNLISFNENTTYNVPIQFSGTNGISWIDTTTETVAFLDLNMNCGSTYICGCEFNIRFATPAKMNDRINIQLIPTVTKTLNAFECVIPQIHMVVHSK